MRLADTNYDNEKTGCCAELHAGAWDRQEFHWVRKPFLKDHIRALFHTPLDFGAVVTRDHAKIEEAEAYPETPLWLTEEVSPWRSDIHVALDRDVPDADMVEMSGTFLTRVFEGPYRDARRWAETMETYAKEQGRTLDKLYFYYATCPRCAKKLGRNQVVAFARVH